MSNQVEISLATPDNAAAVLQFLKQTAKESDAITVPHLDQVTVEQERQNIKLINQFDDCVMLLAMSGEQLVGIVTVMMLAKHPDVGELGVVVAKKYWRNGIGRLLVDEAEYWFTNYSSLKLLTLTVFTTNLPAIKLYEQMHFVKKGIVQENGQPAFRMDYQP